MSPRTSPSANRQPTLRVHGVISGDTVSIHTERTCSAASKVAEKQVPNGQTTIDIKTNTLPNNRFFTFYTKATNQAGNSNCSRSSLSYTLIIPPPVPTRLSLRSPSISPDVDTTPTIRVYGLIEGDTVSLHSTRQGACETNANSAAQSELAKAVVSSGETTIDLTTSTLTSRRNTIYARASNNRGFSCSTEKLDYIVISNPDAPLELELTSEPNPFENIRAGNDNTPSIRVEEVVQGDRISLYTDKNCSGTKVTSDTNNQVPEGQNYIILTTIPLPMERTNQRFYTFYTKASNPQGHSSCSTKKMEYALIREPIPKISFRLRGTSPSEEKKPTFTVNNLVERDIVSLYTDPQCSSTQVAEEVTVDDGETSREVRVTTDLTQRHNQIYVKVRNIVGEKCSGEDFGPTRNDKFSTEKIDYVVTKRPEQPPTFLTVEQPERVAPDGTIIGSSTHPTIRVHGVVPGDTISVHTSDSCSEASKKGENIVTNGRTHVDVVVSSLTEADTRFYTFYAKANNDEGSSSCSTAKLDYALIRETTTKTNFNLKADAQNTGPPYSDTTPTFQVKGLVEKDMISLYTDSTCSPSGRISDEQEVETGGSTVEVTSKELTARFNNIYVRVRSIVEDKCSGEDFGTSRTDKFSTEKVEYVLLLTPTLPTGISLVGDDVQRFKVKNGLITGWHGTPTIQVRGVFPGDRIKLYKDSNTTDQDTCTDGTGGNLATPENGVEVPPGQTYVDIEIELEKRLDRGKTYVFYAKAKNDEGETACHFTDPISFRYKFDPFEAPVGTVEKTGFWVKAHAKLNDRSFEIQTTTSEVYWRNWPLKISSKPPHPDCLRNCDNDKNCIRNCYNDDDCFIDTTKANTRRKITCYVDIPEGVLHTHELELQYNLPPEKCSFFRQTPSWHWNREPGVGAENLFLIVNTTTDPHTRDLSSTEPTRIPATPSHPYAPPPNEVGGGKLDLEKKIFPCIYDHSPTGGPNCCVGNYRLTILTHNSSELTRTVEPRNWGGSYRGCIGGPARMNWENFDRNTGLPLFKVVPFTPENGYSASYKTPALNHHYRHSFHAANYYKTLSHRCRGPACKCHGCTCDGGDCEAKTNEGPNVYTCHDGTEVDDGDRIEGNFDCAFRFYNIGYSCIGKDCVRSDDLSSTNPLNRVVQCKGTSCSCSNCKCYGGDCNGTRPTTNWGNCHDGTSVGNGDRIEGNFDCTYHPIGNTNCTGDDCVRTDILHEMFTHNEDQSNDRLTDPINTPNAPHIFQCLDYNSEYKYEIKVYVREWNTLWDFEQLFKTREERNRMPGGPRTGTISPDVEDNENDPRTRPDTGTKPPSGCPNENGGRFDNPCNDYSDLEDQKKESSPFPSVSY